MCKGSLVSNPESVMDPSFDHARFSAEFDLHQTFQTLCTILQARQAQQTVDRLDRHSKIRSITGLKLYRAVAPHSEQSHLLQSPLEQTPIIPPARQVKRQPWRKKHLSHNSHY